MKRLLDAGACLTLATIRTVRPAEGECDRTPPGTPRFLIVRDGQCVIRTLSHMYRMSMMSLLVLTAPNAYTFTSVSPECAVVTLDAACSPPDGAAVAGDALRAAYPILSNFDARTGEEHFCFALDASVLTLLRLMALYAAYPPPRKRLMTAGLMNMLLVCVASAMDGGEGIAKNAHVAAAQRYIRAHYAGRVATGDVARAAGVHAGHLSRLFHAETGLTPGEYITRTRLYHASELLRFTDIPIKKVAQLCGFSTQQYFARVFCHRTGVTPHAYRHAYDFTCDYQGYKKHLAGRAAQ